MKEEKLLKAIVLNSVDYKEKDKQITLFSLENGKVNAVMKGCRTEKAKLKFAYSPFCFAEYKIVKNGNFTTIIDATLIDSFFDLTKDLEKYYCAMTMLETINHIARFEEPNSFLFLILLNHLKTLCYENISPKKILSKFLLICLEHLGYKLTFKSCSKCNLPFLMEKYLELGSGEFVCENCKSYSSMKVSSACFNNIKNISNTDLERLSTVKIGDEVLIECVAVLIKDLEARIDNKINSYKMLNSL